MSVSCLQNLIQVRGQQPQNTIAPEFWIQDLPAIDIRGADAATGAEVKVDYALIQNRTNLAQDILVKDFTARLAPKFNFSSIIMDDVIGKYIDNLPVKNSESGKYKGIGIINFYPWAYLDLFVSSISIQLQESVSGNILVFDL